MPLAHRAGELPGPLQAAIEQGRTAWPGLDVPEDALAGYLLARATADQLSQLQVGDLYLACACLRGDRHALAELDRVFLRPVVPILVRSGVAAAAAEEVTQVVRHRLLVGDAPAPPRIGEYLGQGSLAGWVRVVALRAALDLGRDERAKARAALATSIASQVVPLSPEDEAIHTQHGEAFKEAFRAVFGALSAEDRLILRLHFAEGLNLEGLAVALHFSRATAGRRVLAARTLLRDETLRRLAKRLEASPESAERVLGALRSRLELSLSSLVSTA